MDNQREHESKKSGGKSCHLKESTAEKLARQYGVSPRTVRNAGKFVEAVDKLKVLIPNIERDINEGTAVPRKQIIQAAAMMDINPDKAIELATRKKTAGDRHVLSAKPADALRAEIAKLLDRYQAKHGMTAQDAADVLRAMADEVEG